MDLKTSARYVGLGSVIATHLYLLQNSLPDEIRKQHSVINLAAAGLIIYSFY